MFWRVSWFVRWSVVWWNLLILCHVVVEKSTTNFFHLPRYVFDAPSGCSFRRSVSLTLFRAPCNSIRIYSYLMRRKRTCKILYVLESFFNIICLFSEIIRQSTRIIRCQFMDNIKLTHCRFNQLINPAFDDLNWYQVSKWFGHILVVIISVNHT